MWFDAQAALKQMEQNPKTIAEIQETEEVCQKVAQSPDVDAFEERAAICEYDAGMTRHVAEDFAAQLQGFPNVIEFKAAVRKLTGGGANYNQKGRGIPPPFDDIDIPF